LAQVDGLSVESTNRYGRRSGTNLDPEILGDDGTGNKESRRDRRGN
jgi:hypothetical protein